MTNFQLVDAPEGVIAPSEDPRAKHFEGADRDAALLDPQPTPPVLPLVIGPDTRLRVTNVTAYPFSALVALQIAYADNRFATGTGWLASGRTVITAGHCLLRLLAGRIAVPATHIRVITLANAPVPSGRPPATQFFDVTAEAIRVSQRYGFLPNGGTNRVADYGAVVLPVSAGATLNTFALGLFTDQQLNSLPINLAGYPNDPTEPGKPFATLWGEAGQIQNVTSDFFDYQNDASGGESGAPVFAMSGGRAWVAGIHVSEGTPFSNRAIRVNQAVLAEISTWLA